MHIYEKAHMHDKECTHTVIPIHSIAYELFQTHADTHTISWDTLARVRSKAIVQDDRLSILQTMMSSGVRATFILSIIKRV